MILKRMVPETSALEKQISGPEIWRFHPPPFHTPPLACLSTSAEKRLDIGTEIAVIRIAAISSRQLAGFEIADDLGNFPENVKF